MKKVNINLYSFNELSEEAKEKAIEEHYCFLSMDIEGGEDEYTEEEVIEHILINDYLFFEDGNLAHITHYTGGHEKSGITEFHFHGRTTQI